MALLPYLFSLLFTMALQPNDYQLTIAFKNLESRMGNLMIRVRNKEQKEVLLKIHPVKSLHEELTFKLPANSYAIDVYHDANSNKELDKNLVGIPKEKYGFSNNPKATFGPPNFKDQLITLDKDQTIEIKLQ